MLVDPLFQEASACRAKGLDAARLDLSGHLLLARSLGSLRCRDAAVLRQAHSGHHTRKCQQPTIFNPPIAPMLRLIGFEDIREVELWQPIKIKDIEIVPIPFHGEQDEPGAEIDHYTYVAAFEWPKSLRRRRRIPRHIW